VSGVGGGGRDDVGVGGGGGGGGGLWGSQFRNHFREKGDIGKRAVPGCGGLTRSWAWLVGSVQRGPHCR